MKSNIFKLEESIIDKIGMVINSEIAGLAFNITIMDKDGKILMGSATAKDSLMSEEEKIAVHIEMLEIYLAILKEDDEGVNNVD